jgi:hypothetical protein
MAAYIPRLILPHVNVGTPHVPLPHRNGTHTDTMKQKFLFCMSLRTGVEMICLAMLFNKVAGLYGLLAIFTGYRLDAAQLSMYIYSILALLLLAFLLPHVRRHSVFECLALAWLYLIDTVVNSAYVSAFASTYFLAISAGNSHAPGAGTITDTAGFTSPAYNVSNVAVVAAPANGILPSHDAAAVGVPAATSAVTDSAHLAEGFPSIVIMVLMTLIRVYFILILFSYARQAIQQEIATTSFERDSKSPFASEQPLGQGWRGRLGRLMIWPAQGFFLRKAADDGFERGFQRRTYQPVAVSDAPGNTERERRARAGTGPPAPSIDLVRESA